MIALFTLCLVLAPLAIWGLWRRFIKLVYRGKAVVLTPTTFIGPSGKFAFVTVDVPGVGWLLADIPVRRAQAIGDREPFPVEVTVRKALLGEPWVDAICWPGEDRVETAAHRGDALLVTAVYFMLGMGALALQQLLASELFLVVSGFLAGIMAVTQQGTGAPTPISTRIMLAAWAVLLAAGTIVLFSQLTFFTIFPGITVAFGFGQVAAMLVKTIGGSRQVEA